MTTRLGYMAAQSRSLSVVEFERLYTGHKPYFEYWSGSAIQKAMPTKLHSALQMILGFILRELGLLPFAELRLMLNPEAQLLPDVAGFSKPFSGFYPTEPFSVAIEILSPGDSMQYVLRKFRQYAEWRIENVFVFDPEDRNAFQWNSTTGSLESISEFGIAGRAAIPLGRIWSELQDSTGMPD